MKKTTFYTKKITKQLAIKMLILTGLLLCSYTAFTQTTPIPDINFENALAQLGLDDQLDGQVLTANISGVTTLDVSGRSISDLTGIEGFTSLQTLNCSNNNLTALNLSGNLALTSINASSNNLPTINFFNNALLVTVDLSFNQLVTVAIQNGGNNNLMIFNVNFNPNLSCVIVDDENNPAFVFSPLEANPDIFLVEDPADCNSTVIPDPNFEQALIVLGIDTGIVNGRVRTNSITAITALDVNNRNINDLTGIEGFTALQNLQCGNNNLTTLDLSNNTALQSLISGGNSLTTLDLSSNSALFFLAVNDNNLITLNIKNGNNTNFPTNITLEGNANLNCIVVDDPNNVPTTISANALPNATFTDDPATCKATISIPDANFEQALIDLGIDTGTTNGEIRIVDITGISTLDVSNRAISDLTGIEGFSALTTLSCQLNNLTSLDVSNNTVLQILNCDENDLTTLNLPTTNTLTGLLCRDNEFTSLDFSDQAALTILFVGNNANLEVLNIKNGNNTNFVQFNATVNTANLNCIVVDDASNVPNVITNGAPAGVNFIENLSECDAINTLIPDMNFEQALIDLGIDSGTVNGSVLTSSIATLTFLDVSNSNINDLTGIEDFVALEVLLSNNNNLTAIDLSNNTALAGVNTSDNALTALDVSNNTALQALNCDNNNLVTLNLPTTNTINALSCRSNEFTSLDFSDQAALAQLFIENNINLEILNIQNGANTNFTDFSATNNPNLSCIIVDDSSNVSSVITNGVPAGVNFIENLSECDAVTLIPDMNFEQALIDLGIDSGTVNGSVLTSSIATITGLDVSNSNINNLTGIEDFVALETLVCNNNDLADLDVSNNTALLSLTCGANALTALDLSNNTALFILRFANNNLTELDVFNNTALIVLSCIGNNLTSLDLSNNIVLNNLNVAGNPNLEVLNIKNGNNTNFVQFNAANTQNLSCIVVDDPSNVPNIITDNAPDGVNFTDDPASCPTLSVNDEVFVENTIMVYPNPSSDKIFIKNNGNFTLTNVKVFNLLGSLVRQTNVTEEIDIARLPNGIYMILIATDTGNVFTKRIIKQ